MKIKTLTGFVVVGVFFLVFATYAAYEDPKGDVEGKVKLYTGGGSTGKKVEDAEVRLYKENGKRVDSDDSSSKGKFNFEAVLVGEYFIKCSADGHVNAKDTDKVSYVTSKFDIKEGKTAKKNCRLTKIEGDDTDYSERPKGTSKREWRAMNGQYGVSDYHERPKGTSKREWRVIKGI